MNPPWTVGFPQGWGAPDSIKMTELISWTESEEKGIKYFSGTAVYSAQFFLPDDLLDNKYALYLDLGEVRETAEVRLNGEMAGILWKPPYRVDVSEFLISGQNRLEISVTNLWNNRIVGDLRSNLSQEYTQTNLKSKFKKDSPLLPSGLLGPVVFRPAIHAAIGFIENSKEHRVPRS